MRSGLCTVLCGFALLTGCSGEESSSSSGPAPVAPLNDVAITGTVKSGTQPVVGAHLYLFAANTNGYGGAGLPPSGSNASVSLLSRTQTASSDSLGPYVTTGSNGGFSLTGDYVCTSGQQLYLYALGGSVGGSVTSGSGLMAALGGCPATSGPAISATVNEVTTVAAGYALAGFATDATHISSSGTDLAKVGLANAFANAANLADISTGTALTTTPAGNGTVPQAEINTLANILRSCVNSASACGSLFAVATSDGTNTGTPPTETATAAINIAHHPGSNVGVLYGLVPGAAPFSPGLAAAPNDWTILLSFTGGGLNAPDAGVAIDAAGSVWTTNSNFTVTKLSSTGAALSPAGGYSLLAASSPLTGPKGNVHGKTVAVDNSGNVWVAQLYLTTSGVWELSNSGAVLSPSSGYRMVAMNLAIDGPGNVWVTTETGSVQEISPSGAMLSPTGGYSLNGAASYPYGIALDNSGNIWIDCGELAELSGSGALISLNSLGNLPGPGLGSDSAGNLWMAGYGVIKFSSSGLANLSPTPIVSATDLAIDGSGHVWIPGADMWYPMLFEMSSTGELLSPWVGPVYNGWPLYNGFGFIGSGKLYGVAVDGSGDVWVGNANGTLEEFVGIATPVVTPLAAGVKNHSVGMRP